MASKLAVSVNGRAAEVEIESTDGGLRVRMGEGWFPVELERTNRAGLYSLMIGGRSYELFARDRPGGFEVLVQNRVYDVAVGRTRAGEGGATGAEGAWTLLSPMSGLVTEVRVAVGDDVQAGQPLLVVESMKMNNELTAARAGTVSEALVSAGERVEKGKPLLRIA